MTEGAIPVYYKAARGDTVVAAVEVIGGMWHWFGSRGELIFGDSESLVSAMNVVITATDLNDYSAVRHDMAKRAKAQRQGNEAAA